MSAQPEEDGDQDLARPLTDADIQITGLFEGMEQKSLDTLEKSARLIITLCTTLLGGFLGVLAFKDAPAYLGWLDVKLLVGLALSGFLAALVFALNAVLPRRYSFSSADLTAKHKILNELLGRKQTALIRATFAFGAGAFLMLFAILDILFSASQP